MLIPWSLQWMLVFKDKKSGGKLSMKQRFYDDFFMFPNEKRLTLWNLIVANEHFCSDNWL